MMISPSSSDRLLSLTLALAQYPILSARIRSVMRRELFLRGVITPQAFETRTREMAIKSQEQEGLHDPYSQEPAEVWDLRMSRIRDQLTDLLFSQHLAFELFEKIVIEVLGERGMSVQRLMLSLNPELAPPEMIFEHAMTIEKLPPEQRARYEPRLQESKVVLIRNMISDQLRYINIAKEWFTLTDLVEIRRRKIGSGRIGGKAAGMLLAARILKQVASDELKDCLHTPESFFIGSDEIYTFMSINNLVHWNDQKYKMEEQMRAEYPEIVEDFLLGEFPPDISEQLAAVLDHVHQNPVIVRSSSLLEDNFGTSFAGKYESIFVPCQGSPSENLHSLQQAIARVWASTLNPSALLYRRSKGLLDYDERMAILIQEVRGERFGKYYMPHAAGVAFSRNLYRWAPQIRREDGFIRLVWGMGTRAVDRVGNDYPRLVALSHPMLRPSNDAKAIRRYSQQYVDLIDLEANQFKTLPVSEVIASRYPPLRYLVQVDEDGYFVPLRTSILPSGPSRLVMTFDELLRRTPFAERMREMLHVLEQNYKSPVDLEFTLILQEPESGKPKLMIDLLQCRPQGHLMATERVSIPADLPQDKVVFSTRFVVPQGHIDKVDYVLYVTPEGYFSLPTERARNELKYTIGRLNAALDGKKFICVGPGRWGSSNSDLGVPIDYGDIYHTLALVELSGAGIGPAPEPSLGTHFFQDILEAQIYPLAIVIEDPQTIFKQEFFESTPSCLNEFIQAAPAIESALRLVRVSDYCKNHHLRLIMDDEKSQAVAYLVKDA
jgi:hypothetical protein